LRRTIIIILSVLIGAVILILAFPVNPKSNRIVNYQSESVFDNRLSKDKIQSQTVRDACLHLLNTDNNDVLKKKIVIKSDLREDEKKYVSLIPRFIAGFYARNVYIRKLVIEYFKDNRIMENGEMKESDFTRADINLDLELLPAGMNPYGLTASLKNNHFHFGDPFNFDYTLENKGFVTILKFTNQQDLEVIYKKDRPTPVGNHSFTAENKKFLDDRIFRKKFILVIVTPRRLMLTGLEKAMDDKVLYKPFTLDYIESKVSEQKKFSMMIIPYFTNEERN
jgi:hypothetical protein